MTHGTQRRPHGALRASFSRECQRSGSTALSRSGTQDSRRPSDLPQGPSPSDNQGLGTTSPERPRRPPGLCLQRRYRLIPLLHFTHQRCERRPGHQGRRRDGRARWPREAGEDVGARRAVSGICTAAGAVRTGHTPAGTFALRFPIRELNVRRLNQDIFFFLTLYDGF